LGFYTDFLAKDIDKLVEALKNEQAESAVRYPLLKVLVSCAGGEKTEHYALNESTIKRQSRTLVANIEIDDYLLEKFRGDGLSVATPTGSTAYNKSIGGAVVDPRVEALQLAEIASLNNSVFRTLGAPMIVSKKDSITIYPEKADDYTLTIDQLEFRYEEIESIRYSLDGTTIAFVNCDHTPFWKRVRNSFIRPSASPHKEILS
jgi:NAD+ kinase